MTVLWIVYIIGIAILVAEFRRPLRADELIEVSEPMRYGKAAWMGDECAGHIMANGQPFNPAELTCACWDFPMGAKLLVTHGPRLVVVTVTDRGPAAPLCAHGRIIDLSYAAFCQLAPPNIGVIEVSVQRIIEQPEALREIPAL